MYFYTEELEVSLPPESHRHPSRWMKEELKSIGSELIETPASYKLYGPYWWNLKLLLKRNETGSKRAWFRGPCNDEEIRLKADHGSDLLNLHAARHYAALVATDQEWLARDEAALHICEWSDGQVELYRVADSDTGHQLDLFISSSHQEVRLQHYLKNVANFLPRTWRANGDRALQNGHFDQAVACYKRMILLAGDGMDRTEGWLLLGMTFDQKKHFNKAIFCYMNLYEKEKQHWLLGNIAASYSQAGKYHRALDFYEQAIRQMPGNPEFEAGLQLTRQKIARQLSRTSGLESRENLLELSHA